MMMIQWQGANLSPSRTKRKRRAGRASTGFGGEHHHHQQQQQPHEERGGGGTTAGIETHRSETVESALNRLSRAYSAALECVGAWQMACSVEDEGDKDKADDEQIIQEEKKKKKKKKKLVEIGRTARRTFEDSLLADPLVLMCAPAYNDYAQHQQQRQQHQPKHQPKLRPPNLTSASHRDTVKKLTYLSLVNYSDLLLSGCPPSLSLSSTTTTTTITTATALLDRGLVRPLKPFVETSCWARSGGGDDVSDGGSDGENEEEKDSTMYNDESEEGTVRRALVALLDATAIDGSDPTVWLKLACLARRLGRILDINKNSSTTGTRARTPAVFLRHRKLEKFALEFGQKMALPSNAPLWKPLSVAWDEWRNEESVFETLAEYPDTDVAVAVPPGEQQHDEVRIELTRYSWSALVRILLRVCREGSAFTNIPRQQQPRVASSSSSNAIISTVTMNPNLSLRLSPLLALPSVVLARLTQFLELSDVRRLEATCRALRYSILSAQAINASTSAAAQHHHHQPPVAEATTATTNAETITQQQQVPDDRSSSAGEVDSNVVNSSEGTASSSAPAAETEITRRDNINNSSSPQPQQRSSSRSSNRVRSQLITSEKRAERSQRRNSTEYCLVTLTLGRKPSDPAYRDSMNYTASIGGREPWDDYNVLLSGGGGAFGIQLSEESHRSTGSSYYPRRGSTMSETGAVATGSNTRRGALDKIRRQREEARERLSESSLVAFVRSCRSLPSRAPVPILFGFVSHVSKHIADVFTSDTGAGSTMVLSSSLLECIDLMLRRCQYKMALIPSWCSGAISCPHGATLTSMDKFAIDLLHAELRFKRCDHVEPHIFRLSFDSDGSIVTSLIPALLRCSAELDKALLNTYEWIRLKARCYWLIANYYFWRGRISNRVCESREAERVGLEYVEETLKCLDLPPEKPIGEVILPHLDSPTRSGQHWKILSHQTIVAFRDDIQASSIVLAAQEQYLEVISGITAVEGAKELSTEDANSLFTIGDDLLRKRYNAETTDDVLSQPKHVELIEDFLAMHGDALLAKAAEQPNTSDDSEDEEDEPLFAWFDRVIPSGTINPEFILNLSSGGSCILSILVTCLLTKGSKRLDVVQLYSRLIITIVNLCKNIFRGTSSKREGDGNGAVQNDSDDDSCASSDEGGDDSDPSSCTPNNKKNLNPAKLRQYGILLQLIIEKASLALQELKDEQSMFIFSKSDICKCVVYDSLTFCAERIAADPGFSCRPEDSPSAVLEDLAVLQSVRSFFHTILEGIGHSASKGEAKLGITRPYVAGLMRIVCRQRIILSSVLKSSAGRQGRTIRQRQIWKISQLLAGALCEVGFVLSTHNVRVVEGTMEKSDIFDDSNADIERISLSHFLTKFCESLVWLWKTALDDAGSTKDRLLVPVVAAIVGLCGSAASSNNQRLPGPDECSDNQVRIQDFYDTDSSALDWISDNGNETQVGSTISSSTPHEDLLRIISQVVHCVNNTFGAAVDEHGATSFAFCEWYLTEKGPLLPLVVARVLNLFADLLLVDFFPDDDGESRTKALWLDYPFGTRTTGTMLDSLLYKAYRCLHGFTLVNASDGKEHIMSSTTAPAQRFPAEDFKAAAMLYRCITRAYSEGRKSPPKAALDTVLDALPPMEDSPKSQLIRDYLFSAKRSCFDLPDLVGLVTKGSNWDSAFSEKGHLGWESLVGGGTEGGTAEDEAMIVRKGISSMLAQGTTIPAYQDSGSDGDERASSSQTEEELGRKFNAIIDDLSLGTSTDCEAWYKAAQCIISKADLIADRLGNSLGFARNHNFFVQGRQGLPENSLGLSELITEQEREEQSKAKGWLRTVGEDLSISINYNWCSFTSLQSASGKVGTMVRENGNDDHSDDEDQRKIISRQTYNKISGLLIKKDFAGWQQAWGGLFVSSLRIVAVRCLCIALFIAYKSGDETVSSKQLLISEVCESIGTLLYSELSGSQVYGYPMHSMTNKMKRSIAEAALICYERAVEHKDSSGERDCITWDLLFMVGKCNEKIAKTYERERFPSITQPAGQDDDHCARRYECYMRKALQAYADSLAEAREAEKEGLIEEQSGGSCHGVAEVFYRIHATRLKCLIAAVDRKEDERDMAELEGLRLTEYHWHAKPEEYPATTMNLRDRVWAVLSDIVLALALCRHEDGFFHRSVFRHAQALMYAPFFVPTPRGSPEREPRNSPATRACKLRGLNYSTDAANSAMSVIGSLFEKKRPQLCSVWVTNSNSASPFETINSATRKYDSLRGKYISAYVDSLRLCGKKQEIENFLRLAFSSKRDLPSYFAASARAQGLVPSHVDDSLLVKSCTLSSFYFLTTVKRQANSALAAQITNEVQNRTNDNAIENTNRLKCAYACFLRLNCNPEDLIKSRTWRYHRPSHEPSISGTKDIVEALTEAYSVVKKEATTSLSGMQSDWSGESRTVRLLEAALNHCTSSFPNLSGTFYTKRRSPMRKKRRKQEPQSTPIPGKIKKSFEVTIPAGLEAGDTFVVSITTLRDQHKKVRLTVPDQPGQIMRFSLEVPTAAPSETDDDGGGREDEPPKKKKRS